MNLLISWGLPLFIISILVQGIALAASLNFTPENYPYLFQSILPGLGAALGAMWAAASWYSYGKIHSVRIFALGMGLGFLTFNYFFSLLGFRGVRAIAGDDLKILGGIFTVLLGTCLIPQGIRYKTLRNMVLTSLLAMIVVLNLMGPVPLDAAFSNFQWQQNSVQQLAAGAVCLIIGLITLFALRDQFQLGGLIGGLAGSLSLVGLARSHLEFAPGFIIFSYIGIAGFGIMGTLVHWISLVSYNISIDPLMRIFNRRYCDKILQEQANVNLSPPLCVVMVDIDHFKKVNDVHGHQAGDAVLFQVAQALKHILGRKGILCRYGGEEMVVFLSNQSLKEAEQLIEKARIAIKNLRIKIGKKKLKVTFSAGISQRTRRSQSLEEVVAAADKAVYKSKKAGRDRITVQKWRSN